MKYRLKNVLKWQLFSIYKLATRFGVHILPTHFYSPVPNIIELEKNKKIWANKSDLPGLSIDLDKQIKNLKNICLPYQSEYYGNEIYNYAVSSGFGLGYGYIEAQALHAIIRYFKPRRVIEVGSGVSTWCTLTALKMNRNEFDIDYSMTCIDPYPSSRLKELNEIVLLEKQVQAVVFEDCFTELKCNDFLFIDSSHTVKPGSDVNYLILEILPRLNAGTVIHFHDIYLPYDYPRDVLQSLFCWTETSLLRAFLVHNTRVNILFCLSHLHYDRKEELKEVFPEYNPQSDMNGMRERRYGPFGVPVYEHFPSSIYIQVR